MTVIKVLYDGWSLVRQPSSSAALHLLTLLAYLPEQVEAVIALPEEAPDWFPRNAAAHIHFHPNNERAHVRWEQRTLPRLALQLNDKLLHTTSANAPLFSHVPVLVSPTGFGKDAQKPSGLAARMRVAMGGGGYARAAGFLWPIDLPVISDTAGTFKLPVVVHPDFTAIPFGEQTAPTIPGVELPDTYTLYHGPGNEKTLRSLLKAWTWAAGPIGEYYPLQIIGLDGDERVLADNLIKEYHLGQTVRILPPITFPYLARIYQNCSALYHPAGVTAWGGPLRHAIACGRPVVAFENAAIDAIAGPAVFLVPHDNTRVFGAAMISVVIKEEIYEALGEAAAKRSQAWRGQSFGEMLINIYESL